MYYKILFSIFLSLSICEDTITQITDVFPSGKTKEIILYQMNDDLSSDFTLLPFKKYIYHPNGRLYKYQEYWDNGKKAKEVLVQREHVIERHWDIKGFSKGRKKFKKENYTIPSVSRHKDKSKVSLSSLSNKIDKIKRDLAGLSLNVREITNNLGSLNQNSNTLSSLDQRFTEGISSLNNQISQLELELRNLKSEPNSSNDYKDFEKDVNKEIDSIKDDIKAIRSEINSTKKKKKKK